MNVGELTTVASNVDDLAAALTTMQQYVSADKISDAQFGQIDEAQAAAQVYVAAIQALATSVGKAQAFAAGAHNALLQASKATTTTDEEASASLFNAGQGA
jgi:hypothetical protein